ncbi:MAG: hypothetical protein AAB459_02915, partial [Patescibacteria group bacterium]
LVFCIFIFGAGVLTYWLLKGPNNCSANYNLVCAVNEAAPLLEKSDYTGLAPVVTRIQGIEDYQFSPDLNVIVLEYALGVGDASLAQKHYDQLNNIFNDDVGYDEKLINAKTPEEYKVRLEFTKQQIDEARKNLFGVPKDER